MGFGRKSYWLKQGFVLSVTLNILFLCLFYCSVFRMDVNRHRLYSETLVVKDVKGTVEHVDNLINLDFNTLISLLSSVHMIDGHPIREWALGILFSKYCLDVISGLGKAVVFHRIESSERYCYLPRDLNDADFSRILNFCASEHYPYSSRGLFRLLSQRLLKQDLDERLFFRFLNTKEFIFFRNLIFANFQGAADSGSLMRMIIEGGEDLFFNICSSESMQEGLSVSKRRGALCSYLEKNQILAARLLLDYDMVFILNEMSDLEIIKILHLVNHSHENLLTFLEHLLRSYRGKPVKDVAYKMYLSL